MRRGEWLHRHLKMGTRTTECELRLMARGLLRQPILPIPDKQEEAKQAILAFADSKILEQHTGFGTKELEIIDHALSTLQQALAGEPLP